MSLINEYKNTEAAIKELEARLAAMKTDVAPILEIVELVKSECADKKIPLRDIALALCPELGSRNSKTVDSGKPTRKERTVKVYKNPHNGEVVETKGGNHKTLKEWKLKWGGDVVEGWVQK